jgi:aryl-alcohol dehydrogenase (NADP+)
VSEVGLGTLTFGHRVDEAAACAILDVAAEAGVTLVDTADVYPPPSGPGLRGRAEEIVGRWLRARGARPRTVVATKVGRPMGDGPGDRGLGRAHILLACDASLRRLGTDYIDLYQVHAPDPLVPVDETLRALDDLVRAGKVRAIGCSNYPAPALAQALSASAALDLAAFGCVQVRYNLLCREAEETLLPLCRARAVAVAAHSPLAGGRLAGRRTTEPAALPAGGPPGLASLALAWVLAQSAITTAIVGASQPEQLRATLRGLDACRTDAAASATGRGPGPSSARTQEHRQ